MFPVNLGGNVVMSILLGNSTYAKGDVAQGGWWGAMKSMTSKQENTVWARYIWVFLVKHRGNEIL